MGFRSWRSEGAVGLGIMNWQGGGGGGGSGREPSETEIMGAIKQQVSSLQTMEFLKTVRDKCYAACIPKPGSSLSSREETCLDNCMDRYADAIKTVTQALNDGKF